MTNRRFFTFVLALLIAASTALVSCSSDKENGDGSDTAGSDSAGQKIEQNLPVGEDTTDAQSDTAAPAPVITEPPAN